MGAEEGAGLRKEVAVREAEGVHYLLVSARRGKKVSLSALLRSFIESNSCPRSLLVRHCQSCFCIEHREGPATH